MIARIEDVLECEERRAKKVAAASEFLRDPDLQDFYAKLFGNRFKTIRTKTVGSQLASANGNNLLPDGLRSAIRAIAPKLPNPCTSDDVLSELKRLRFVFHRSRPQDAGRAVRDAMWALSRGKGKVFDKIADGKGGKLNKYVFRGS